MLPPMVKHPPDPLIAFISAASKRGLPIEIIRVIASFAWSRFGLHRRFRDFEDGDRVDAFMLGGNNNSTNPGKWMEARYVGPVLNRPSVIVNFVHFPKRFDEVDASKLSLPYTMVKPWRHLLDVGSVCEIKLGSIVWGMGTIIRKLKDDVLMALHPPWSMRHKMFVFVKNILDTDKLGWVGVQVTPIANHIYLDVEQYLNLYITNFVEDNIVIE